MVKFECQKCGHCCTRQLSMTDGKEYGIYLTPEESKHFPEGTVFPLFRSGGTVFAFQLGLHRCPNFDEENKACRIYENRPLICRSFPAGHDGGLMVLFDRCAFTSKKRGVEWDMRSFESCFQAMREQMKQAQTDPQAEEMFILNGKKWIPL